MNIRKVARVAAQTAFAAGMVWVSVAQAGTVTVTGSFDSYSGPLSWPGGFGGSPGFGTSQINGVGVVPTVQSTRPGVGLITGYALPAGTTAVEFKNDFDVPNAISFTAGPAVNVNKGDEFLIGTLTYTNGSWFGGLGEGDARLAFTVTTASADPALNGHVFSDVVHLAVTQFAATNTPAQNADYFWFEGRPDLGTLSVYETNDSPTGTNVGSFNFYGRIGSLVPTRLESVALNGAPNGGFVGHQLPPVPEPGTWALLLAGLAGVAGVARRRR